MNKHVSGLIAILGFCGIFFGAQATHLVKLETTSGNIVLELDSTNAPGTVANFLKYVRSSFYNGTIFHRVIEGFMIQGGGHTEDMTEKDTDPPINNEAYNGLDNVPGSIAMAREDPPHTATSQFYINTVNNFFLNYVDSTSDTSWGYCVFGKVIEGMDVVKSIETVKTETVGMYEDVPKTPIIINKAEEFSTGIINSGFNTTHFSSITFQAGNAFSITGVHMGKNARLELYNLSGRRVFSYSGIKQGQNNIPQRKLSAGVYVFGIKVGKEFVKRGNVVIR